VGKIDAVLSGRLLMRIEGQQVTLEVGDMLEVPRDVVHSAAVVGNGPVVSVDAAKMNGS
jgi:mannose-6-phosphate isomerase-like protein (cupin superfamily)